MSEKSKYNGGFRKSDSRDRSADELRYSIRSLIEYLPWHSRTLYILTNNQIPKWLDTTHPRIQMVFHKDIFPEHITPTYDSSTIELFLDKIPGLTECFIYFNDDFFANNYIHPAYFFTSKTFYPKVYRSDRTNLRVSSIKNIIKKNKLHKIFQASKYFTNEIIKEYFDKKFVYRNEQHSGYVFYRDLFEPFRQLFKEELKIVCADRFRSPYKLHFLYLYHTFLQYATRDEDFPNKFGGNGKAREFKGYTLPANRTIEKYSVEIVPPKIVKSFIKYAKISDNSKINSRYFKLFKKNHNILIYNFNDAYSNENAFYEFTEYMITRYPDPSEFEKREYIELEQSILSIINETMPLSTSVIKSVEAKFSKKYTSTFKRIVEQYKKNVIKEYINIKEYLSGPKKEYSDSEMEEISSLLKYNGEELSPNWEWAKKMSFVYILENAYDPVSIGINELKYSIRSLEKYLPWFEGDIFIVTQTDVTYELLWLDSNNTKIHVINQSEIIPEKAAQTQNIHIIEMYLDKIPGISERFVYLKNNHFFINYIHPNFFFSKDFYPKYNLKDSLTELEIDEERRKNTAPFNTYNIIRDVFSESYVKHYRYFKDAPFPLYRDLFEPSRKLYERYVNETLSHTEPDRNDLLPLYIVSTYNIYGTDQPYYPEYVAGYGKIRNAPLPILNKDRTIDYYGFDIPSPIVSNCTMMLDIQYTNNKIENKNIFKRLSNTKRLFFSLKIEEPEHLTDQSIDDLIRKLNEL